ncbi:MAG: cobyric acid synthase [Akkermansia sp.]
MIHFLRHTKTVLPAETCYGCSDVALCPDCWSADLPQILAQLPEGITRVYSSPLSRCRQLAEQVAQHLDLPEPTLDVRLQEMDFGQWERQTWDDIFASDAGKTWFADYLNQRTPEGESFQDMILRAQSFLDEKAQEKNMLIVTHAGFIRAAMVVKGRAQAADVFDISVAYGELLSMPPKLRPIMFVGTGSDVGKSMLNAGFCRIFKQDGYQPAPFKAQNMSLNSYATPDALEIGRAQAVQAEACALPAHVDMNPVLLKPTTHTSAQLVLLGKPSGTKSAKEYFLDGNREELFSVVKQAFDRLESRYSPVVMEGAGSISEMNLWDKDIVNMRMAQHADAATYLIADIDRGGVFASVYGSIKLLPESQRKLIKGVLINKFRGDLDLFIEGRKMLEEICGVPVVGVIPYLEDVFIEQEDSVILSQYKKRDKAGLKVAVLLLRSMSNFTDFNQLARCQSINFYYTHDAEELREADIIIIPGSKNTIADMEHIREQGFEEILLAHHRAGKSIYGICGGYQMMGEVVLDPEHIEGPRSKIRGLGILPIRTTIKQGKLTRQCRFQFREGEISGRGYEIHSGESPSTQPLCQLDNGEEDGYILSPRCWGSYLHGIFDNQSVINSILVAAGGDAEELEDYHEMKERNYDLLANRLRELVDMEQIYASLQS